MALFGVHLAFKFFKNYLTLQDTSRGSKMHAAWGWLSTGYAATIIINIVSDFYATDTQTRYDWLEFGYVAMSTGALIYIYNIESIGIIKTKYMFTISYCILYFILLVLLVLSVFARVVSGYIVQLFMSGYLIPMILLFIYTAKINQQIQGKLKVYSAAMIIGLFVFILGFLGATDVAVKSFEIGSWLRFIADIFQIVGLGMIGFFFSLLPSWREIEWRTTLKSLFIIYQGGTCIYQHDFTGCKESDDVELIIGNAVEMVKSVLDQVLLPGSLKVFDFKDKKMVLEQGKHVSVAIIADSVSDSLDYVLHEFTRRFEAFFEKILQDWNGDSSVFEPTKVFIKSLFG